MIAISRRTLFAGVIMFVVSGTLAAAFGQDTFVPVNTGKGAPVPVGNPEQIVVRSTSTGAYLTGNGLQPGATPNVYLLDSPAGDWTEGPGGGVSTATTALTVMTRISGNSDPIINNLNQSDPDAPQPDANGVYSGTTSSPTIVLIPVTSAQLSTMGCDPDTGCTNPNIDTTSGYAMSSVSFINVDDLTNQGIIAHEAGGHGMFDLTDCQQCNSVMGLDSMSITWPPSASDTSIIRVEVNSPTPLSQNNPVAPACRVGP